MSLDEQALERHRLTPGKIALQVTVPLETREDISLAYTPGVGAVCREIAAHPEEAWSLTSRGNWIAVVTDGSAVLGLGNIGPLAGLPVMEGKAALFKKLADVNAFPICLATQDTEEIIRIVTALAPSFAGINLEDIAAPRCFEIEARLRATLDIPVFHDDQHGTAIAVLAALMNALTVTQRSFASSTFVVNGAGAAGITVARMLLRQGAQVVTVCDSKGILATSRTDLHESKRLLFGEGVRGDQEGSLADALRGADVFIGVSAPNLVTREMVATMAPDAIVIAMANPVPEILPEEARAGGAGVVATGRSDYPNQVNNALVFPGLFRGALDARAKKITDAMKDAAARALALAVGEPSRDRILPSLLEPHVAPAVAKAVQEAVVHK